MSNLSQDPSLDWLDRGLTEMLTTNLAQVPGIDVLSTERVQNAAQTVGTGGGKVGPAIAVDVARNAGADAFITGSLLRIGPTQVRLDVRAQDTSTGQILFSERAEGQDVQSVFGIVDTLTGRIAKRFAPDTAPEEATPSIEEALTSNLEAYRQFQLGQDLLRRFLHPEAIAHLEEATRLDPQFASAYLALAQAYGFRGDFQKAQELRAKLDPLRSRLPRREQLWLEVETARRAGDVQSQILKNQALLAEFPRDVLTRNDLAQAFLFTYQPEQAVAVVREGLARDPKNDALLNQLCYAEAFAGNTAGALEANDRYQEVRPGDPNPWDTRGDVLYLAGRHDEALAAYRKVLELKPDFIGYVAYLKLMVVYTDQKKFALAESAIREYASRASSISKLYLPMYEAQLQESRGQLNQAHENSRKAVLQLARAKQYGPAGQALAQFSVLSIFAGNQTEALTFVRQQDLQGEEYPAIAVLEAVRGNREAAERSISSWAAAHPQIEKAGLDRLRTIADMNVALARGDAAGAVAASRRIADTNDAPLLLLRARAHLQLKEYGPAEQLLRRALFAERVISNPNSLRSRSPLLTMVAHYMLGQVHEATGRRDEALNEYQEFLSHFEGSNAPLPHVADARAAVARLIR